MNELEKGSSLVALLIVGAIVFGVLLVKSSERRRLQQRERLQAACSELIDAIVEIARPS